MRIDSLKQTEILVLEKKAGEPTRCCRCRGLMGRCVNGAFSISGHLVHRKCAEAIVRQYPQVSKMADTDAPQLFERVFQEYRVFLKGRREAALKDAAEKGGRNKAP